MKRCKALALLLGTLLCLLLPGSVLAASPDLSREVSLTICLVDGETPLSGSLSLYQAARMEADGSLTVTGDFERYPVDLKDLSDDRLRALASTLEGYVQRDDLQPMAVGKADAYGMVTWEHLTPGLYLAVGERLLQDGRYYDFAPVLVILPGEDGTAYHLGVRAKFDSFPVPDEPDETTVTRKVLKVWADDGREKERPRSVTVQLLRDGKVYDTVTLSASNNWRHTWRGLDSSFRWTLAETEPDGYTVSVTREGVTFVVTNTVEEEIPDEPTPETPGEPSKPGGPDTPGGPGEEIPEDDVPAAPGEKLPQTGQLWWPVPALLCAGLALTAAGLLRRRNAHGKR